MRSFFKRLLRTVVPVGVRQALRRPALGPAPTALPPPPPPPLATDDPAFLARKRAKLDLIRPLLTGEPTLDPSGRWFDYLTDAVRGEFQIVDTERVSAHPYDEIAMGVIGEVGGGWVLDCGAGLRDVYFDRVVNFEICPYPTTDVRGVGERLPFRDGVFDAVFSLNVLEHVRDPFACAAEIARVLKPGGRLYAVVPFLQPFHAYPHHYYNMSAQGLANLFAGRLEVDKQFVHPGGWPVFALTWLLARWGDSLPPEVREKFLDMKVRELNGDPIKLLGEAFVTALPEAARFELACTTSLFARKPAGPPTPAPGG